MPVRTDLVIAGGSIVDGTGSPAFEGDVAVRDGRIVAVGPSASDAVGRAARVIDARGRTVTPGFVDIHTHSDIGVLQDPTAANALLQGATTHVTGNCGESPAPIDERTRELAEAAWLDYGHPVEYAWTTFADYLAVVERTGVGINIAPLVGHGTVRLAVLGYAQRPPTTDELEAMRAHVDEAMRAGAFGLSGSSTRRVVSATPTRWSRSRRSSPATVASTRATSGVSERRSSRPCANASRSASEPDAGCR